MFLFSLRFSEVYWVIFLRSKGLSFAAIGLLETIFHISSMSGEIPTGILADRKGRKVSLVAGRTVAAISSLLILEARSWSLLAVGFVLNAISYTCHSGAFEALVYDSLSPGQNGEFTRLWGNLNSIYLAGTALTAICAAVIARLSLDWLYVMSVAVDLVAVFVSFLLDEPPRIHKAGLPEVQYDASLEHGHKQVPGSESECQPGSELDNHNNRLAYVNEHQACQPDSELDNHFRHGILTDIRNLVKTLQKSDLRNLLFLWGLVCALGTSIRFLGQSFLQEHDISLTFIGIAGTLGNFLAIVPTRYSYRLQARFGSLRPVVIGSFLVPALVLSLALVPRRGDLPSKCLAGVMHLSLTVAMETMYPIFSDVVNSKVGSHQRATVLSSGSMMFSLAMMGVFPTIGFAGDRIGLSTGMIVTSCATALGIVPIIRALCQTGCQTTQTTDSSGN